MMVYESKHMVLVLVAMLCLSAVGLGAEKWKASLPHEQTLASLGNPKGITAIKAGAKVILQGEIKDPAIKIKIWKLGQHFGNIVDMTTMTDDARKEVNTYASTFTNELKLAFSKGKAESLAAELSGRIVNGRLVMHGLANNPDDVERLGQLTQLYDPGAVNAVRVRKQMIEIDAIFARVEKNRLRQMGLDGLASAVITMPTYTGPGGTDWDDAFRHGLWNGASAKIGDLTANLQDNDSDLHLLVRPHLSTLNGKSAVFHAGGQVGYQVATQISVDVVFKDFGTKLTVLPKLTSDGKIDTEVKIEFLVPLPAQNMTFSRYAHEGHAIVGENQALVLSGMIQQLRELEDRGIPGLNRLPILRYFFGHHRNQNEQYEMVVLIHPRIPKTVAKSDSFYTSDQSQDAFEEAVPKAESLVTQPDWVPMDQD